MAPKYANQQPPGFKNKVTNIAIVGASGKVGTHFVAALLSTNAHTITALTRPNSPNRSKIPSGVRIVEVDYDDPSALASALTGQDVLIITLPVGTKHDAQEKFHDASATAGVPWVFPNEYGIPLTETANLGPGLPIHLDKIANLNYIEGLGVSSWICLCTGFWYEFSLAGTVDRYGFDFKNRRVVFIDEGKTKINTSTWDQCGKAMAALLSLPVLREDERDQRTCLSQFANECVYISSFEVSQKDMFDSVLRVTETKEEDWSVSYEDNQKRYESGVQEREKGNMVGLMRMLYTKVFESGGIGNYGATHVLHNDALGLPKEDIDLHTKIAVDVALKSA